MAAHPELELAPISINPLVDMVEDGVDAALRIGPLEDSRLGRFRFVLVASPGCLARRGTPVTLDALDRHDCLRSRNASTCQLDGRPLGPAHVRLSAPRRTRGIADPDAMLLTAALGGAGIACIPDFRACEPVRTGDLRILLPGETVNRRQVSAVRPGGQVACPKVAAFVGFLAAQLSPVLVGSEAGPSEMSSPARDVRT